MTAVRVTDRAEVADGVVALTLSAVHGTLDPWEPGAHVDLYLPGDHVRQYSLCGDPADRSSYRVAVLREPDGRGGSAAVHDKVAPGDILQLDGPRNHFALVPAPSYLFVAGGIGITPILPMIAAAEAAGARWRLLYGGRRRASMAFTGELPDANVTLWPQDERGLLDLDTALAGLDAGTAVYCCGPEPLLQAVESRCPAERLHVERFAPKQLTAAADADLDADLDVELAQTGRTVRVPAGTSILHALEASGLTVLSSCQEGTCGTCETGVLAGVPDHRDSVLSAAEQAAGDVMMICVSRARTPALTLDL